MPSCKCLIPGLPNTLTHLCFAEIADLNLVPKSVTHLWIYHIQHSENTYFVDLQNLPPSVSHLFMGDCAFIRNLPPTVNFIHFLNHLKISHFRVDFSIKKSVNIRGTDKPYQKREYLHPIPGFSLASNKKLWNFVRIFS